VAILMGVIALNGALYVVGVARLKEKPEMYAQGNADMSSINLKTLWGDVRSILRMRAFWTWFFYGLLAFAPAGIYFTAFLYYMDHVIRSDGLLATVVDVAPMALVFLVLPAIGTLVKRAGGKRAILIGMVPYVLGYALLFFSQTWWQALISYTPIMFGKYLASTAGGPLGAAIIDENEMLTGTRKTGLFAAVGAILSAPVGGLQMIIFTQIIAAYGYDAHAAVQSAQAMLGIRLATAVIPIAFCLVGAIPLLLFPYDREKEAQLSAFSAERRRGAEIEA
ncbi:MAG: hypothetical protein GX558_01915, partial [Clostridiales bacterium]|nr:hypothetical protein [Clostridiales bacterium]